MPKYLIKNVIFLLFFCSIRRKTQRYIREIEKMLFLETLLLLLQFQTPIGHKSSVEIAVVVIVTVCQTYSLAI